MENNGVNEKKKSKKSIIVVILSLVLLIGVFLLAVGALTDTDTGTDILPEEDSVQMESEKKMELSITLSQSAALVPFNNI